MNRTGKLTGCSGYRTGLSESQGAGSRSGGRLLTIKHSISNSSNNSSSCGNNSSISSSRISSSGLVVIVSDDVDELYYYCLNAL